MAIEHFIIAGAQRSGTTWLYSQFERHPQVCMAQPLRPEPKFFLRPDAVSLGYADYRARHFAHQSGEHVLGEKSTSYIERTDCISRIHAVLPDVRLIFVLRDPVRRAYSNWRFSREQGVEDLSFEDALVAEPGRIAAWSGNSASVCPFAYAARGHYAHYLALWERHFPRERIMLATSESFFSDENAISGLFARLGLDTADFNARPEPVNASEDDEGEAPDTVIGKALGARYEGDMQWLQKHWGLDTSAWLTTP